MLLINRLIEIQNTKSKLQVTEVMYFFNLIEMKTRDFSKEEISEHYKLIKLRNQLRGELDEKNFRYGRFK